MKEYIISVIAAALLSGIASVMSPEKWRRYVGLVSGMVILYTIIAPISKIDTDRLFAEFNAPDIYEQSVRGEELQTEMVKAELTKRINRDIEERLKNEFGLEVKANSMIEVNAEGKIIGVDAIEIKGRIGDKAAHRLKEVYGVDEIKAS